MERPDLERTISTERHWWREPEPVRWGEPLFGRLCEVTVSVSLGHSVLFKLRRRALGNTPSAIWLDHGDLLVMDGLTQSEYVHSTASLTVGSSK